MTRPSALGALLFEAESTWAESSSTFANRFPQIGQIDVSGLVHDRVDSQRTVQYAGDYGLPVITTYGGSFRTKTYLCGHGSTTSGAVTAEEHETVLAYAIGNATSTGTGTPFTGGTVTAPTTTSASGLAAGGIIFAGELNAGGTGQAAVVSSHASNTLNLLTALPGAPVAATTCYSAMNVYPTETAASQAITSSRWRILTANQQYDCHGVYPQSLTIEGTDNGGLPTYEITWGVSRWTHGANTFPTTTSVDTFQPAPMAGGSLFVQSRGTATRQVYSWRSFRINIDLGVQPLFGPGASNAHQHTIGAVRGMHSVTAEFVVDSETVSATPTWPTRWDSNGDWHMLLTFNGASTGQRMAFYMPNACFIGSKPVQFDDNGINRERVMFRGRTGPTTTSELTLSSYRFAFG